VIDFYDRLEHNAWIQFEEIELDTRGSRF
jgi:hypothetical protein